MKKILFLISLCFLFLAPTTVNATHVVGGSLSYEHLGGSTYRVTLRLYRDCGGVAFPGTVTIWVRDSTFVPNNAGASNLGKDISITFPGATTLAPFIDTCAFNPGVCVQEAIYTKVVNNLPPRKGGYHMWFSTCCRNASLLNVSNPLNSGTTYYAYIPDNNIVLTNSSPQWVNFPPIFVCVNRPLNFDHSATDIDGDSLVYSLYQPYDDSYADVTTHPVFTGNVPRFDTITYSSGTQYKLWKPLGAPMSVTANGLLVCTPPNLGQYVVGIKVTEYRNGKPLGFIVRDFQFNVLNCPPPATAGIGPSDACKGQAVVFNNNSSANSTTFHWNFGDPSTLADTSNVKFPTYTYPSTGTYTVMLIVQKGTPCADTAYRVVTVSNISAKFNILPNDTVCQNTIINFQDTSTATAPDSIKAWAWNFGDSQTSTAKSPPHLYTSAGTYQVQLIVTSKIGCRDTLKKTVVIMTAPVAVAGKDTTACKNNPTVQLNGSVSGASGGVWTGGAGTYSPNNVTLNATYTATAGEITAGSVTLILTTTGNGPCGAGKADTITIVFTPSPTVNAGPDVTVCVDTPKVTLNGAVTIATGGIWTTLGSGTFSPNATTLNADYLPSNADKTTGFVYVILSSTGNGNCLVVRDTMKITFVSPLVNATAQASVCAGYTIALTGTSSTGAGIWTSNGNGSFVPNDTTLNASYQLGSNDTSTVMLILTSRNNGGCLPKADTVYVTVIPAPVAAFSSISACAGDSVKFFDASTTKIGTITSWAWDFDNNGSTDATTKNTSYIFNSGGTYSVTLVVTSNNGCKDTLTQNVTVYYKPLANFNNSAVCLGDQTTFMDSSMVTGGSIVSWAWNFGDQSTSNDTSSQQNTWWVYGTAGNYTVNLIVVSSQGCKDTVQKTVTVNPSPIAAFVADDYTADLGQLITFSDQSSANAVAWFWNFGDPTTLGDTSHLQNPTYIYNVGGKFKVMLVITDIYGCKDTIYKEIVVSLPPKVPSGFSPNGDDQNDILYVYGGPFDRLEFKIYNNWGELIFISTDQSVGWDGMKDGVPQPIGVYVYTVVGDTPDGITHHLSGDVTLLR